MLLLLNEEVWLARHPSLLDLQDSAILIQPKHKANGEADTARGITAGYRRVSPTF